MQKRSRLNRTSSEKTKKQIVFLIITIIVILVLLIQLGPIALNVAGGAVSSFQTSTSKQVSSDQSTLEAPFIESIPLATDSGKIRIEGSSPYTDAEIELYVNGKKYDTEPLDEEQKFSFSNILLTEGDNYIKVRVKKGDVTSFFTKEYVVEYLMGEAKLEVTSPSDNQEFSKGDQNILVQGKSDPDNTVTVNGFRAIVDSEGNFSYHLSLSDGDNQIKIEAITPAGTKSTKELKVIYKP